MKCLVFSVCSFLDPHLGVLIERAERLHAAGHEVTFAYCAGGMDVCGQNPQGSHLICAYCRFTYWRLLKRLARGIVLLPVRAQYCPHREWNYATLEDFRKLRYGDTYVGYAALSTYITLTRNSRPDLEDGAVKHYLEHLLDLGAAQTDWLNAYLDGHETDEIHIYTGRLIENRAFYDVAISRGITFYSNEVVGGFRAETDFMPIAYKNALPHNLMVNKEMAEQLWRQEDYPLEDKRREGRQFYEKRRNNQPAGDRVYTGAQEKGLLPEGFDKTKKNIVVFNSSEDEFAAIGKDFDDYQLFGNQTKGIVYLLDNLPKDDYSIYVRIHPNLSRVKYDYVLELYDLPAKYPNVTLISPTSPVSTYALMDFADKIVVFGSTAGAEATYAGKPVVLLGPSFYYFLDVAYTPCSKQDAVRLLMTDELPPKDRENALKYAYFVMNRQRLTEPSRFVDLHIRYPRFLNIRFCITAYSTLLGSCLLMKLFTIVVVHGLRCFGKWKLGNSFFRDPFYKKV